MRLLKMTLEVKDWFFKAIKADGTDEYRYRYAQKRNEKHRAVPRQVKRCGKNFGELRAQYEVNGNMISVYAERNLTNIIQRR